MGREGSGLLAIPLLVASRWYGEGYEITARGVLVVGDKDRGWMLRASLKACNYWH